MKVLVTGVKGQLGFDVCRELEKRGIEHIGVDKDDFDITDKSAVSSFIMSYNPDVIVHCSAYTAVDKAEKEKELCRAVNEDGTRYIAETAAQLNAKTVYISTDYVFNGIGGREYETYDEVSPINTYGQTKLGGELAVKKILSKYFIIRISWVFGINGNNFINTMLRLGKDRRELNVVNDQIGSPTYTADLSPLICDMINTEKYGTYHATNEGFCSWADFAAFIFKETGMNVKVNGIPSAQYPAEAARPLNSRMSKKSLDNAGFKRLPSWQDAVKRYIKDKLTS